MSQVQFTITSSFMLGLTGLVLHRTHLLSALLCLEGMMLSLFIALSLWTMQLTTINFASAPILLLAFSACEASMGLALLVAMTRTHGSDHLRSLSLLQC
uniref:NADH-ubiquinone oxidoreductase chain 4L n=1 Tax=Halieutaea stellata TaxID=215329 RepID=D3NQE2_9TELE|nr:NADH dehydrogenase subunit 4L [Halieutaea stellata]